LPTATATITHYFCIGDSTGAYCGNTASGARVSAGSAACDPARLGQTVSVGAETYLCVDTGGAVRGDRIDIWCYSSERWGWPPDERPCPEYGDGVAVIWETQK
jgi:3D (Asp-Asp-Asp) domain-containing protein